MVGTEISQVYLTVIPSSFNPTAKLSSWDDITFAEFELLPVGEGKYAARATTSNKAATMRSSSMRRMQMVLLILSKPPLQ